MNGTRPSRAGSGATRAEARALLITLCVLRVWGSSAAGAQDFSPAEPPGPSASPAALIERGLPDRGPFVAEALATSWLGIPGLVTRTVCAAGAIRSVRAGAGWSQTGDPQLGWTAFGLAIGTTARDGGAAVRAVARRDRGARVPGVPRDGAEVGGGAWVRAGAGLTVWARAPQLAASGWASPALSGLAAGLGVERDGLGAWFEREAPARRSDESGIHAGGVSLDLDAARLWVEGRSSPLRTGFGITLRARHTTIGVRVLSHPRLGDTISLSVSAPSLVAP